MIFTGKALTIWQPWASLITWNGKDVENRSWRTKYRGPLAIHAGLGWDAEARRRLMDIFGEEKGDALYREWGMAAPKGMLLAVCHLADCLPIEELAEPSPWAFGPYCWLLKDIVPIKPVLWRGAQGLWNVTFEYELVKEPA